MRGRLGALKGGRETLKPMAALTPTRDRLDEERSRYLDGEFVSDVARDKTESVVEPVRIGTSFVGRKLNVAAPAATALRDRPFDHILAYPTASSRRSDSDSFDLSSPRAFSRETRNEANLQGADDLLALDSDDQELVRVGLDCGERGRITCSDSPRRVFSGLAEHIVKQELNDGHQIFRSGASKD